MTNTPNTAMPVPADLALTIGQLAAMTGGAEHRLRALADKGAFPVIPRASKGSPITVRYGDVSAVEAALATPAVVQRRSAAGRIDALEARVASVEALVRDIADGVVTIGGNKNRPDNFPRTVEDAFVAPGEHPELSCECGTVASWHYDPSTRRGVTMPDANTVPYCAEHGPNPPATSDDALERELTQTDAIPF